MSLRLALLSSPSQAHSMSLFYSTNRAGSSAKGEVLVSHTSFVPSPSNRILVTGTLPWAQSPSLIVVLDFLLFTLTLFYSLTCRLIPFQNPMMYLPSMVCFLRVSLEQHPPSPMEPVLSLSVFEHCHSITVTSTLVPPKPVELTTLPSRTMTPRGFH